MGKPVRRGSRWRLWTAGIAAVLLIIVGAAALGGTAQPAAPPGEATPAAAKLTARGRVSPVNQAKVGTLAGGVVRSISARVGATVEEGQEIARVRGESATEVLTAPWSGTITGIPVHTGDTIVPGTTVATIADLSRLHVETTDVDEFLIAGLRAGQTVTMTVDALDRRQFEGRLRTVGLQLQPTGAGDDHYPVVIDVAGPTTALRPGMTVRVYFIPEQL